MQCKLHPSLALLILNLSVNYIVPHDVALPSISLDKIGYIAGTLVKKMVK